MKLTLIEKRPYKFENENGKVNEGWAYTGYAEKDDEVVTFSSPREHEIVKDALGFDPKRNEDFDLGVKTWQGKVKRYEITV